MKSYITLKRVDDQRSEKFYLNKFFAWSYNTKQE